MTHLIVSVLGRPLARLSGAALRAGVRVTPLLLTASLVGCASSAQHRAGAAGSEGQTLKSTSSVIAARATDQAMPYRSSASLGGNEQSAVASTAFKDEDLREAKEGRAGNQERFENESAGSTQNDQTAGAEKFRDDASVMAEESEEKLMAKPFADMPASTEDDVAVANPRFSDETTPAKDDAFARQKSTDADAIREEQVGGSQQFADEGPGAAKEEAATPERFSDEGAGAMKEEAVAPERFADEAAGAVKEEAATPERFVDEAAGANEETGTSGQFVDEVAGQAKQELSTPELFNDEESDTASEQLVRPPENFADEEKLAQTEDSKPAPATVLPMTITVEADPLFDFDRYAIRPEAREKLDALVQQLKGVSYGEVIAVGFADPIGTKLYNQSLSQRRAESVEQYLVNSGIPADRVRIEARGQTEDFAAYRACDGHGRQNLIECLQPDRRVEVTVTAGRQQ